MALNAQYISPLPDPIHHILDIGCGTGKWAIEFATEHPTSNVVGVDLSAIQPPFVPPNCTFIVDNAEQPWIYTQKFDFIHARALVLGIRDWPKLFRQAWEFTNPGGWIELQEGEFPLGCDDGSAAPDSPLLKWSRYMQEAARSIGIDTGARYKFREWLEGQGYGNVRTEEYKWAIGGWPRDKKEKEIGRWMQENLLQGLSGGSLALFTRQLGWTLEEVEAFLVDVRKQIMDPKSHVYLLM
jgi:ubiquinone/menaquinone biosynthesis C-methylase UbiE